MSSFSGNKAWVGLTIILIVFFFAGFYIYQSDLKRELSIASNESKKELVIIAQQVKERLQKKDYLLAKSFITAWGNNDTNISEIVLTAENGFEIEHFYNAKKAEKIIMQKTDISYAYDKTASLIIYWNIDEISQNQQLFMYQLLSGYFFIFVILFLLVRLNIRTQQQKSLLQIENKRRIAVENSLLETNTALQHREQDLSITLNSIGDAVIATDAEGNVVRMNPVAEQLTGWTLAEAKGVTLKTVFPIIDASTREVIENPVEKVIASGETIYLTNHTTLIAKDGTEYQIADSAAPIRDKENQIQGMVLVFNNVTEQYKLRHEISDYAQHLKLYREQAPLATIEWNVDFEVLDWNKAAEKMFGYKLEEVKGRYFVDFMLPESAVVDIKQLWIDLIAQTGGTKSINENITKDGHTILCEWHNTTIRDEEGNVVGAASIVQDITRQRKQEEQNRQTQKMDALGKLTGGIAHDFNNMLAIILGYSELLETELADQPELNTFAEAIRRASERGAKLTNRLLAFSRKKSSDAEVHNINTILRDEQDMLQRTLTSRIELTFELDDELWPVFIDAADLEDAIINVSINAMHAIDGNGRLTISTRNIRIEATESDSTRLSPGDYVLLSITDTGSGMSEEVKKKIFDPFYTTKGEQGNGLGLSQVYGFIERSHGAIHVYSEVRHGTQLMLYFPRYYGDDLLADDIHNDADLEVYSGSETVLVVDDEPALVNLASEILRNKGYTVFTASSGNEALTILGNESVDVMLSDVVMPEMDGYQLAQIVQQQYPAVKIQLASGFSDNRHKDTISHSLHENLLQKPYDSRTLLKKIRGLINA